MHLHAAASDSSSRSRAIFRRQRKRRLAASPDYLHSVKLAFEAPRFWETDDFIFGGLAWTDRMNENVIYPSDGYGAAKGVIVGAYCAGWTNQDNPDAFARLSHEERLRISREFDRGAASRSVAPARQSRSRSRGASLPYSEGVGALWPDFDPRPGGGGPGRGAGYAELLKPEGPDRLRRRASELSADLAGRRRAVRARGAEAGSRPWPARKWLRQPTPGRCAATSAHGGLNQKTASGIAMLTTAMEKPSFVAGWTSPSSFRSWTNIGTNSAPEQEQECEAHGRRRCDRQAADGRPQTTRIAALSIEPLVPCDSRRFDQPFQTMIAKGTMTARGTIVQVSGSVNGG